MGENGLRRNIIDELDYEPSIDAAGIEVAVNSGRETRTGHVSTSAQKSAVEDVVRRVKGIRGIAEELEVRPSHSHRTADEETARRAVNSISWNTSVPDGAVQVEVQKGMITLTPAKLPFQAGWKSRSAAAAQLRAGHFLDDVFG